MKDGGAVLLLMERGRYHSLNASGVAIWSDIGSGATIDDLVSRVAVRHPDVARNVLENDVREFVTQLEACGAVTLESAR